MPDARPPGEDPFADLYGKLPDPRRRDEPVAEDGGDLAPAPTSRRAAREAAAAHAAAAPAPAPAQPASFEDLFTGTASSDAIGAVPPRKTKKQKHRGRWVALGIVVVVLAGIAGGGWYVWSTYEPQIRAFMGWQEPQDYEAGLAHGQALVTIADGDTGSSVSKALAAAGVTKTSGVFYNMLVASGQNPTFYPGVYKLQKEMTAAAALAALLDPASKLENTALVREGLTEDKILPILADALKMPLADFQAAVKDPAAYGVKAKTLEGWLFPATYTFKPSVTAKQVIQTLVDRTVTSLDAAGVPEADRERILTIASIIQREARVEGDFYKVSRVIENRLQPNNQETFGKLQMDSTAQYGYHENHNGTASSSAAALADDNPWNTYVHAGLPIGPIASPGDVAIDAAMRPAPGPWMYFVTVNLDTGETVFSATYAEQQKAIVQMQTWCKAHPDSGC
ncbi:endolytic transglycosylase MltG [Microbacterium kribbense]|uniref:Endolytic murein transglycosylase n=1 Tax=Microbacterium kribbense TaxID=433645 RepID=A0ABP7GPZ1_9MICO